MRFALMAFLVTVSLPAMAQTQSGCEDLKTHPDAYCSSYQAPATQTSSTASVPPPAPSTPPDPVYVQKPTGPATALPDGTHNVPMAPIYTIDPPLSSGI